MRRLGKVERRKLRAVPSHELSNAAARPLNPPESVTAVMKSNPYAYGKLEAESISATSGSPAFALALSVRSL
jgi:hypothetical protein